MDFITNNWPLVLASVNLALFILLCLYSTKLGGEIETQKEKTRLLRRRTIEMGHMLQLSLWKLEDKVVGLNTQNYIQTKIANKLATHAYDKAILALSRSAAIEKSSYVHKKYNTITNLLKQDLQNMKDDNPFARTINPSNESILDYYPPGSEYEDEIDEFNNPAGFENGKSR